MVLGYFDALTEENKRDVYTQIKMKYDMMAQEDYAELLQKQSQKHD